MAIDLIIGSSICRIIAVYLPYAGYPWEYFQSSMDIVSNLLAEAVSKNFKMMVAGDFNLSIGIGSRGELFQSLCDEFRLIVTNGDGDAELENKWTFRSSAGELRRIDYILISNSLQSCDIQCGRSIDL